MCCKLTLCSRTPVPETVEDATTLDLCWKLVIDIISTVLSSGTSEVCFEGLQPTYHLGHRNTQPPATHACGCG
jgi:hypothetical protein